jgi:hypothetical protein
MAANPVDGVVAEAPRTTLALVQNEAEALRTPNRDLRGLLVGREERWHVVPFGERSFPAALHTTELYDGLVFGYNAIHESHELKQALRDAPPACHMLILHQFALDCLAFLQGELALRLHHLPSGGGGATPPPELSADDEVLLNWPHRVHALATDDTQALRGFAFEPDSSWRVLLEVERQRRRFPVLVRTAATAPVRIVACSLMLDVHNGLHRLLLENMLTYCTLGRPRIAVLDTPDAVAGYDPERLAAKLRLQGASTIVVRPGSAAVCVGDWPLKVAERVVVPACGDGRPNTAVLEPTGAAARERAERWKKAGGAIVEIGLHGTATVRMEMEDTHAIARRWAVWLHGEPEEAWTTRTFQLRAVLRMLDAIERREQAPFELRPLEGHAGLARRLLVPRLSGGNLEQTIGTTAAACDIDELVGGCLPERPGKSRSSIERWLRAQVEDEDGRQRGEVPVEERLDVARALRDPRLLARALASIDEATSLGATAVIRLREAAVACAEDATAWCDALARIDPVRLGGPRIARELDGRMLASAEFVAGAADFQQRFGDDPRLAAHTAHALEGEAAGAALATLARIGSLAQGQPQEQRSPQEVSAEALALYRYMDGDASSTFQIWPQATEIPPKAVESVLRELAKARVQRDELGRERTALGVAVSLTAGIALGTLGGVLLARRDAHDGLHAPWGVAVFGWVLLPLALLALRWRLDRRRATHRDMRLARHLLTPLALIAALLVAIWLVTDVLELGLELTLGGFALLATGFFFLLRELDLLADWGGTVLGAITSPGETAAALGRRLRRDR